MPESRPSALVFATAPPSAAVPIVSPTSIPAAPALSDPIVATVPATIAVAAPPAVSHAEIITTLPPTPISTSVVPSTSTPVVSPALSGVAVLAANATAATTLSVPITTLMPAQITPAHIPEASPVIQKDCVEKVKVLHVEATSIEEAASTVVTNTADQHTQSASMCKPAYSLPLHKIDIKIGSVLSRSQHQLQNCHHDNYRSHPPCNKPEKTSCGIYPLQQMPPVTVIPPLVLKYPNK